MKTDSIPSLFTFTAPSWRRWILNKSWTPVMLLVVGVLAWCNPETFLWRDEWRYLESYFEWNFGLFKGEMGSDIKPLYQYMLFIQFHLFGEQFQLYQLINVLLHIGCSVGIFVTLLRWSITKSIASLLSLLFLLHPVHFVNVLWIFQQCELTHILLTILCLYFFKRFNDTSRFAELALCITLLLVQNFFFPSGALLPVVVISVSLYQKNARFQGTSTWSVFIAAVGVLIIHLGFSYFIQQRFSTIPVANNFWVESASMMMYLFKLLSTSVIRLVIPNYQTHSALLDFGVLTLLVFAIVLTYRQAKLKEHRALLIIGVGGLISESIILAIARHKMGEVHYYYTSLHLPFLCFLAAVIAQLFINRTSRVLFLVPLIPFLFADHKGKEIFSNRNVENKRKMEKAIMEKTPYHPSDDPFLTLDPPVMKTDPVILYEYLRGNKFNSHP